MKCACCEEPLTDGNFVLINGVFFCIKCATLSQARA